LNNLPNPCSGSAFTTCQQQDLDFDFALQHERSVARDNTVVYGKRVLQLEQSKWRFSYSNKRASCQQLSDHSRLAAEASIHEEPGAENRTPGSVRGRRVTGSPTALNFFQRR